MKIKKNGQVIRLTESDLKKIVKRVLVTEAVAATSNISVDPAATVVGYYDEDGKITDGNMTLNPEDPFRFIALIPSESAPGSKLDIYDIKMPAGGVSKNKPVATGNTEKSGMSRKLGIKTPSFVALRGEIKNINALENLIGKKVTMQVTGNFEGSPKINVPIAIPSSLNIIGGSNKS